MSLLFCSANSIARLSVSTIGAAVRETCAVASCAPARTENIASIAPPTAAIRILFTIASLPPIQEFPASNFLFLKSTSLVSQRLHRLQARRLIRRQIPEEKSRRARHHERYNHAERGHRNPQTSRQKKLRRYGDGNSEQNPDYRPATADHQGFHQELIHDPARRQSPFECRFLAFVAAPSLA